MTSADSALSDGAIEHDADDGQEKDALQMVVSADGYVATPTMVSVGRIRVSLARIMINSRHERSSVLATC